MAKVKRRVLVTLALCLSVCLAGREDRLAYKDDLEKMLKDLEDISQKEPEKTDANKPVSNVLDSPPQPPSKPVAPTTTISPIPDISPGSNDDILDQISQVIESYKRKKAQTEGTNDGSKAEGMDPTTTSTIPPTTTEHVEHTRPKDRNEIPSSQNTSERARLLKDLAGLLDRFSNDGSTQQSTICTTAPSTTTESMSRGSAQGKPDDKKRLEEEALELAVRATKFYLHLQQS